MATTVNNAFLEFLKNTVNLDPDITKNARQSRDNLLKNISEFSGNDDFFNLASSFNISFGSFARKTKCRELDDIDLMIGISANGATYNSLSWDNNIITASKTEKAQISCANEDGTLNSIKVVNRFKKELEYVREYKKSEIKRNQEAIVLNLISKDWSFDIVPCFQTTQENDGRTYYLIPDGKGGWKKTDPRIDRDAIQNINQKLEGKVLELIRLIKRWNRVKNISTLPSYLFETLLLEHFKTMETLVGNSRLSFLVALVYIASNIHSPIYDPKNIQGNINTLSYEDRNAVRRKALEDAEKALNAIELEDQNNHSSAINIWCEIFGKDFPKYE
jgi:hypothetical protein